MVRPYKSQIRFLNVVGRGVVLDCLLLRKFAKIYDTDILDKIYKYIWRI